MPSGCCAVGCTNRSTDQSLEFYSIPKGNNPFKKHRREKWLAALNRENWPENRIKNARLCSAHFVSGKASLDPSSPDFVPTVFKYKQVSETYNSQKMERYERSTRRAEKMERTDRERKARLSANPKQGAEDTNMVQNAEIDGAAAQHATNNPSDIPETVSRVQFDELSEKYKQLELDHRNLQQEVYTWREENKKLRETVHEKRFGIEKLRKDASLFTFYTGLQIVAMFDWIVDKVKANLVHCKQAQLSIEDHVLLIIIKLRLGLLNIDIAYRFSVTESVVSKVIRKCLPIMAKTLSPCIKWPSREAMRKNMPTAFRKRFRNCVCIIDCTEVFIERFSRLDSRAQTLSNYKHHNTIKYLIGITPAGAISFMSDGWGGRVSDKQITVESGFLEHLVNGDLVMADRGFLIRDELAVVGASLTIPHFTKKKKQLPGNEVDVSRQLSRARIHVERVIGRWRNYRILSTVIPISMADLLDEMVTMCACLTNISRSVVNKKSRT